MFCRKKDCRNNFGVKKLCQKKFWTRNFDVKKISPKNCGLKSNLYQSKKNI